jgi:UDP-N-acetyl-D-mannosaminuronic acid dehydrogenase
VVQNLKRGYPLSEMTVGVLGMAFKPDSDDPRSSLSYKLRKVLLLEARNVLCTDPYVTDPDLVPLERVLAESDLLLVATPHTVYRDLVCRQPLVDITGIVKPRRASSETPAENAAPTPTSIPH